jgi:hypothetical protein
MGMMDPSGATGGVSSQVGETLLNATQSSLSSQLAASGAGQVSFSSLADFQRKYPKLYQAFMQSFAYQICSQMQSDSARFIAAQKQMQQDNS